MRHIYRITLLIGLMSLLVACGQGNVVPSATPAPSPEPTATNIPTATPQAVTNATLEQARPALIRIVNSAANSSTLNVFAGFSAIATNLAYTQFTEPTSFEAGKYAIKIQASGSSGSDPALLESDLIFPSGESIIILITGSNNQLGISVVSEKPEALKAGESIINVINALSDGNAVTLRDDTTTLTSGVGQGKATLTPILPAGDSNLTFQMGDNNVNYTATLKGQANTTLVAAGSSAQPSIIQFDRPAPKRISVRAINTSPEIASMDVYLDEELLQTQVNYGRPTPRQNFASGQYTVRVYAAGADRNTVEPLTGQVIALQDGENFSVVILGSASALKVIAFAENLNPTKSGDTRVSFLNTLPNMAEVDVQTTEAALPGIPVLFYGQAPVAIDVQAGSYSFIMIGPSVDNDRPTVEFAERVQFEQGYNYLYLVTGRQDNNPIILSDKVESLSATADEQSATNNAASSIRFINAVEGQTLDFSINGVPAVTALQYGIGSDVLQNEDQSAVITVTPNGQANPSGRLETTFDSGSRYTILAHRMENGAVGVLVINDDSLIFDNLAPHLRFINVSANDDSLLGLAFSESKATANPTVEAAVTAEATEDLNKPPTVFTLPFGVQKLVSDIAPRSASSIILIPVGVYDLDIIESASNRLAQTLPKTALEGVLHMDIVAYQQPNSDAIAAFAVIYPKPQA